MNNVKSYTILDESLQTCLYMDLHIHTAKAYPWANIESTRYIVTKSCFAGIKNRRTEWHLLRKKEKTFLNTL